MILDDGPPQAGSEWESRVVILTRQSVAERWAGDWVQAVLTARALRPFCTRVEHLVYRDRKGVERLPPGYAISEPCDVPADTDVLHFIPGRLSRADAANWTSHLERRPLLVGSTIFWDSAVHRTVIGRNRPRQTLLQRLRRFVRASAPGRPDYSSFDLLLTNSQAEIAVCRHYLLTRRDVIYGSVPNGVVPMLSISDDVPRHSRVPSEPYIVYPGVFAPRKNQLGFIRAVKREPYHVVFMGGPLEDGECRDYFELCRREAPKHWVFLGHVEHCSEEFIQVLHHATLACLASSCETPGIALLEAATLGARPIVTREGGTCEYYGFDGEYFNPLRPGEIVAALQRGWARGRLAASSRAAIARLSWTETARQTVLLYRHARQHLRQ